MGEVNKPVALVVLDGIGISGEQEGNAVYLAQTPFLDQLMKKHGSTVLRADGLYVGLPDGQMGNSEVGHMNLGAGRVVYQELTRITQAIESGAFYKNQALNEVCQQVRQRHGSIHLWGLLSDGGVHSHIDHLKALLRLVKEQGITKAYVHAVTDGRDVSPKIAEKYLTELHQFMDDLGVGQIASVMGRYYAMDRDKRWDRTQKAYDCLVHGKGEQVLSVQEAVQRAYERGETDEFISPTRVIQKAEDPDAIVKDGDGIICFNFRPDRARQLTWAFVEQNFNAFQRETVDINYVCFTQYDAELSIPVAYPPERYDNTMGEYLAHAGKTQLRIAETEKYAHVTFFFNGGVEKPNENENRILVPSPQHVATYDELPDMSAAEVTERLLQQLNDPSGKSVDFILLNYANPDMVGHTGNLEAAVQAIETIDGCLSKLIPAILEQGGVAVITSDHGNAEQMIDLEQRTPHTAHTSNVVPFLIVSDQGRYPLRSGGKLADVAPTLLDLMGLNTPDEMTGRSLLDR